MTTSLTRWYIKFNKQNNKIKIQCCFCLFVRTDRRTKLLIIIIFFIMIE